MCSSVIFQFTSATICLSADFTFIWFLSRVRSNVIFQDTWLIKRCRCPQTSCGNSSGAKIVRILQTTWKLADFDFFAIRSRGRFPEKKLRYYHANFLITWKFPDFDFFAARGRDPTKPTTSFSWDKAPLFWCKFLDYISDYKNWLWFASQKKI